MDEPTDIVPVAYVTKNALTEGIFEVHGWERIPTNTKRGGFMLRSRWPDVPPYRQAYIPPNGWTLDLNEAIERVKRALSMRVSSLEGQIARLKAQDPAMITVKR